MLLQLANILAGALLASHFIRERAHSKFVYDFFHLLHPYESIIGLVTFGLGIAGLIERLGLFYFGSFGASYPQAIPAIAAGLLLGSHVMKRFDWAAQIIEIISPHRVIWGFICMAVGIGSLLFGCIAPVCFPM